MHMNCFLKPYTLDMDAATGTKYCVKNTKIRALTKASVLCSCSASAVTIFEIYSYGRPILFPFYTLKKKYK